MEYIKQSGQTPAFTGFYEEVNDINIVNYCYITCENNTLPKTKTKNGVWRWLGIDNKHNLYYVNK